MGPIIIIILLALLSESSRSDEKRITVYTKNERPLHHIVPDDKDADEQLECMNEARPYVVLSHKEKRKLELMINTLKFETDPNLLH